MDTAYSKPRAAETDFWEVHEKAGDADR
jgi:hypothetical protein